jgi:hypothetical protein
MAQQLGISHVISPGPRVNEYEWTAVIRKCLRTPTTVDQDGRKKGTRNQKI